MNQHDQMLREALLLCQQANLKKHILNTGETLASVVDKALAAEPVPLARLTDKEIERIFDSLPQFRLWTFTGSQKDFAHAIMDAMQEKNK